MSQETQIITELAVNASVLAALFSGLLGAFIGTYLSARFISYFNESGVRKIRKLCCDVLDMFKKNGNFSSDRVKSKFNETVAISQKRAILVCLHKIGVPVANLNGNFNIDDISFLEKEIVQEDIDLMKSQINTGMCDTYFFMDVDSYFNENIRLSSIRAVAKRYVDEVMRQQRIEILSDSLNTLISVDGWHKNFTPGELNIISTFREIVAKTYYFDLDKKIPNQQSLDQLKQEIDIGMWDNYLQWDYMVYQNLIAQKNMVDNFNLNIKRQGEQTGVS